MDTKVYKFENQEVTVYSCLASDNTRFYSLFTFTTLFHVTNFAKIVNRLKTNEENSNGRLLRYLNEFNIKSNLRRTSVFVSALGLKDVIMSLQNEKRYHYWEFVQSILREYNEILPKHHGILVKKLEFEGESFDFVKVFGDDIEDFFYLLPLGRILKYKNIHTAICNSVSFNNIRRFISFEVDYVVNLEADTRVPIFGPNSLFINAKGFNELILASRLPCAQRFKDWLLNVWEQLRLEGEYVLSRDAPRNIQQDLATISNVFGQTGSSVIQTTQTPSTSSNLSHNSSALTQIDIHELQLQIMAQIEERVRERIDEHDKRIDERLDERDKRLTEQVDERLDERDKRLTEQVDERLDERDKRLDERHKRLTEQLDERVDERLTEQEERSNRRVEEHLNQCVQKFNQSVQHTNKNIDYHNQHVSERVTHRVNYEIFVLLSMLVMPNDIRFSITRGRDLYVRQVESKWRKFAAECRTDSSLLSSKQAERNLFITIKKYKTANATVSWNNIRKARSNNFLDNIRFKNGCKTVFTPLNLQTNSIDPLYLDTERRNTNFVYNRNSLNWLDPVLRDYKDKIVRFCDEAFRKLNREANLSPVRGLPMLNSSREPGPSNVQESGPSNVQEPGPSNAQEPGPSNAQEPGPSNALEPGPSNALEPEPSNVPESGP